MFALFFRRIATAPEPFISLAIMRNRVVARAIGCAALAYARMIALTIYTPVYFETVLGLSASAAGLMLIPFMLGTVIGSTVGGRLMSKATHYKRIALIATPFAIAALLAIALAPAQLNIAAIGALMFVAGAGLSPSFPITTVSVQQRRAALAARHRDRRDQLHARADLCTAGRALWRVPVRRQRARPDPGQLAAAGHDTAVVGWPLPLDLRGGRDVSRGVVVVSAGDGGAAATTPAPCREGELSAVPAE